jgi:hypothetical protein
MPVFERLTTRTAAILRHDLEAAGVPYETDEGVADFHASPGTYISNLVASGASVKTCQTLARHSNPSLTIGIYAKASLHDVSGAVEKLPDIAADPPDREAARATGTDGPLGGVHEGATPAGDCFPKLVQQNTLKRHIKVRYKPFVGRVHIFAALHPHIKISCRQRRAADARRAT